MKKYPYQPRYYDDVDVDDDNNNNNTSLQCVICIS